MIPEPQSPPQVLLEGTEDNNLVALEVFLPILHYTEMTPFLDPVVAKAAKAAAGEVMMKLAKVADEKAGFHQAKLELERQLDAEAKKCGVSADRVSLNTRRLSRHVENLLSQTTSALDVLSRQFLSAVVGYKRKWHHQHIIEHMRSTGRFDKEAVDQMARVLGGDWATWLKGVTDDRNINHVSNLHMSDMTVVDGSPRVVLIRSDGTLIGNVTDYVDINWRNLVGFTSDVVWLSFCAINPIIKFTRVGKEYFLQTNDMRMLKHERGDERRI